MLDISVFTPLYNRSDTIRRVYDSLSIQSFKNFEWIVVDDGSTDSSLEIMDAIIKEHSSFPIKLIKNNHGGKHRAVNKGLDVSEGRLFFMLDSDDWLVPDALEKVIEWERRIPLNQKCAGLCAGMKTPAGEKVHKGLQSSFVFMSLTEMIKHGMTGDHADILYTEVFRKYKYPEIEGEYHIAPGVPFIRMANDGYKLLFFDEPIYIADYRSDGLTAMGDKKIIYNFKGYTLRTIELLKADIGIKRKNEILLKYSLICLKTGVSFKEERRLLKSGVLSVIYSRFVARIAHAVGK